MPAVEALSARSYPGCRGIENKLVVWGCSPDIYGRRTYGDGAIDDLQNETWDMISSKAAPSPRLNPLMSKAPKGFQVFGGRCRS